MPPSDASSTQSPSTRSRWRLAAAVAAAVLVSAVSLVTVTVTGPRVSVKWQPAISGPERLALEQRHALRNGRQDDPGDDRVWRYELGDWSHDAVAALVQDPAVDDTTYIDRSTYEVDDARVTVATRIPTILARLPFPFSTDNRFESLWFCLHVQSLCLIVAGCAPFESCQPPRRAPAPGAGDRRAGRRGCRAPTPLRCRRSRMADSAMYTKNRTQF